MVDDSRKIKIIEKDTVILMSYSITNRDGRIVEARTPNNPVEVLVGHGQILKALEEKIIGETEGFKGDFNFKAEEAHGKYRKELVVKMEKSKFPEGVELKKGMKFESQGPNGEVMPLHILAINKDSVIVDGNHPLAGEDLSFDINVLEVRKAAKEEIAQGRVLSNMEAENKTLH